MRRRSEGRCRSLHTRLPKLRADRLRYLLARQLALRDSHHHLLRGGVTLDFRRVLAECVARVPEAALLREDARLHEVGFVEGVVREREDMVEVRKGGGVAASGVVRSRSFVEEEVFRGTLCVMRRSVSVHNEQGADTSEQNDFSQPSRHVYEKIARMQCRTLSFSNHRTSH